MTTTIKTFGFMPYDIDVFISRLEINEDKPNSAWQISFIEEMPILSVPLSDEKLGFLSPFRGYRFQVSATFKGSGDLGSTEVMTNMYRLTDLGELGAKVYAELAELAYTKATGMTYIPIEGLDAFYAFVALCYEYFRSHYELLNKIYA